MLKICFFPLLGRLWRHWRSPDNFAQVNFTAAIVVAAAMAVHVTPTLAQDPLPWHRNGATQGQNPLPPDEGYSGTYRKPQAYEPRYEAPAPRYDAPAPRSGSTYYGREPRDNYSDGQRYDRYERRPYSDGPPPPYREPQYDTQQPPPGPANSYSDGEIMHAGHQFFGTVSSGLAKVVEYVFSQQGRPNGYILGEEAGGAFVAGLRYGEGILYTKDAGRHRVYWQGPSIGYDFGAEGSKTMILVYNLYGPEDIYGTFGGVSGSAYLVGGVGVTFQKRDHMTLAPIRAGVGARLGANIGYLKYTRRPTWNPF